MKITVYLRHPEVSCWNFSVKQEKHLQALLQKHHVVRVETAEDFLAALQDTEIAIVWYFKQEWFTYAPKLKHIVSPAAGRDYFQVTPPEGVHIWNSGFHGSIMAETAVGYILAHARGLSLGWNLKKNFHWDKTAMDRHMKTVRNSTIGILGFGRIGQETAKRLKALEPRILGFKRSIDKAPKYFSKDDMILPVQDLHKWLPKLDHLLLILPRTSDTDKIIGETELSLLPKHAALYNLGRGNAIDEDALAVALTQKDIAAAYLDVFETEPLAKSSPLWSLENCFIYPHSSAMAPQYLELFCNEFAGRFNKDFS